LTLPSGTRLGHFDIVELLGSGAMGTVYRAHDARLHRDVAIKVLPPAFASDPDRLRRFEQEALAVARLAHPHIVAIHDVGSFEGAPYLVMELLAGETLRARINRGPLPPRRAVDLAVQIGRGLAAAHAHGIVHRDIKPENLFVTSDGHIKILDFGIAKLKDPTASPDVTAATETVPGVVGTPAYMSPEQVRGTAVDLRSDLFSLGIVVYEMISAASPFRRATAAETMTAILIDEPPPFNEAIACPPALERILRHCLEKDPSDRFQSARDLVFDFEGIGEASPVRGRASAGSSRRRSLGLLLAFIALPLLLAAVFVAGRRSAPGAPAGVTETHRLTDFAGLEESPAIAPDLKAVAFTARVQGHQQVFVRLLAGGSPLQLTKDPVDHEMPRWSANAGSLLYFSPAAPGAIQGAIWEVPALGGALRRVIDSVGGGDVARDGRLAAFRLIGGHIELVSSSSDGADVRVIVRFDEPVYYRNPRWSPDGRWIAYQRGDGFRWDIFVVASAGGSPRQLTDENRQISGLAWRPDSSAVIYSSSRATTMAYLPALGLWEVPFDGGEITRVAPLDLSYLYPDVHASGTIVASRRYLQSDLWKYPIDGSPEENTRRAVALTHQTGQVQTPTTSPDDREIAFLSDTGGHANLWVTTASTGELRQITFERDPNVSMGVPIWSPDGKSIAFVSSRGNTGLVFGLWTVSPDGSNLKNLVPHGLGAAWSADGRSVYFVEGGALYKVPANGGDASPVRARPVRNIIGVHGGSLYFMVDRTLADGTPGFDIHVASPENAPSRVLARIDANRVPPWQIINPSLSPDGALLAMPLTDGVTTNIWTLSTTNGDWRQITDFGDRPTFIARRVSWSSDGRSIFAAVSEGDADIVVLQRTERR
jgi:Tol biopolymer transport system component